jgi:7-cyano-7-deazaguanine synthase in queuosine biosynthesis
MTRALILPWSGGMDSTTLLLNHLDQNNYDAIYTLYIDLVSPKASCEHIAIQQLQTLIKNCEFDTPLEHRSHRFDDYPPCNSSEGIFQPPIWLMYLAFYAGDIATKHDDIDINLGYIRGDDAIKYQDKIEQAWMGISGLTRLIDDPYNLIFPFRGMTKRHVKERLEKYDKKYNKAFSQSLWVCEDPRPYVDANYIGHRACGECLPCSRDPR